MNYKQVGMWEEALLLQKSHRNSRFPVTIRARCISAILAAPLKISGTTGLTDVPGLFRAVVSTSPGGSVVDMLTPLLRGVTGLTSNQTNKSITSPGK
jgi:hypothetical protein